MAIECKYPQTKSYFKVRGIINGLKTERKGYGFMEGKTGSGNLYRSLRFNVKTSETNNLTVEMFGQVQKEACFYNKKTRITTKVDWAKRNTAKIKGSELIAPDYDNAKTINDTYKDGDGIVIIGEIQFSEYEGKQQTKYVIKQIYAVTETVDFTAKDFVEESMFEHEIIINDVFEVDKKLFINAYAINYGDKFQSAIFELTQSADPKFVANIKKLKYGTFLKVNGIVNNRAIVSEVAEASADGWGEIMRKVTTYQNSLEIVGAFGETLQAGLYKESEISEAIAAVDAKIKEKDAGFNPNKSNDAPVNNTADGDGDDGELPFDL